LLLYRCHLLFIELCLEHPTCGRSWSKGVYIHYLYPSKERKSLSIYVRDSAIFSFLYCGLVFINSNNTPLQQQQETAAAAPQDPHSRQQPF